MTCKLMVWSRGMITEKEDGDIAWKGKRYARVLDDYPYADDGLLIWDAVHSYFSEYLKVSSFCPVDCIGTSAPVF